MNQLLTRFWLQWIFVEACEEFMKILDTNTLKIRMHLCASEYGAAVIHIG